MKIDEIIIVEGVYDKNTLLQVVDATVIDVGGFGIFKDKALLGLLRRMANERGVIILTDSDGAGFVIRNHLKGVLPPDRTKHAYIPDVYGKERRKRERSKEGKLGVEGMSPDILLDALRKAGASLSHGQAAGITAADLYAWGLSGGENSSSKRDALKKRLELPERLSSRALLNVLEVLYTREELELILREASICGTI